MFRCLGCLGVWVFRCLSVWGFGFRVWGPRFLKLVFDESGFLMKMVFDENGFDESGF